MDQEIIIFFTRSSLPPHFSDVGGYSKHFHRNSWRFIGYDQTWNTGTGNLQSWNKERKLFKEKNRLIHRGNKESPLVLIHNLEPHSPPPQPYSYSCKFLQPINKTKHSRQAQEKNPCKISFSLRKRKLENTIKNRMALPSVFFFN